MVLKGSVLFAQHENVIVKADPRVDTLIRLHIEHNAQYPLMAGYRIQIFKESGNKALDEAKTIMDQFSEDFPDIPTYLTFQEPYYRVRAGNFKTKLEALGKLEKIKKKYRNVWVISDYVYYADTINQPKTNDYEQENNSRD
jgi:uncharacterized lipoprotein YehR (DUF1307 family)